MRLPADVYRSVAVFCAAHDMTIKDFTIEALENRLWQAQRDEELEQWVEEHQEELSQLEAAPKRPLRPRKSMERGGRRYEPGTLGARLRELLARQVPASHVAEVDERLSDFFVDAFGILDFPPALGINPGDQPSSLRIDLLWPSFLPATHRQHYEEQLRDSFARTLAAPLTPTVSCELAFAELAPERAKDYGCYFGPTPGGYEGFAAWLLEGKRAVEAHPDIARSLYDAVNSLAGKSEEEKRQLLARIRDLAARLHAA